MADADNKKKQASGSKIVIFGKGGLQDPLSFNDSFPKEETIVEISCGFEHSAIVCKSGNVYFFRTKLCKSDLNGKPSNRELMLINVPSDTKITQVACGCDTTFFLSNTGELYTCGLNHRGQLGIHHMNDQDVPIQVTNIPVIKKVAAGMCQTVAISAAGEVYISGHHLASFGGKRFSSSSFIHVLTPNAPFVDVSCGGFHYALLSTNGLVFVIGSNSVGELGSGKNPDQNNLLKNPSLQPVDLPMEATAIACGMYHTIALTSDGTVWAWGCNAHGQLGVGNKVDCFVPTRMIRLEKQIVIKVTAGADHSAILTQQGSVFMCGRGEDGELGNGTTNLDVMTEVLIVTAPLKLAVKHVAYACSYTLVLMLTFPEPEIEPA